MKTLLLALFLYCNVVLAQDKYETELSFIFGGKYKGENLDSLKKKLTKQESKYEYDLATNTVFYYPTKPFPYDEDADSIVIAYTNLYNFRPRCLTDSITLYNYTTTFFYRKRKDAKRNLKRLLNKFELNSYEQDANDTDEYFSKYIFLKHDQDNIYMRHYLLLHYSKKSKNFISKYPYRIILLLKYN